jgi:hypothetical protein
MKKRGLNNLISAVLLIFLAVVAVIAVWAMFNSFVSGGIGKPGFFEGFLKSLNLQGEKEFVEEGVMLPLDYCFWFDVNLDGKINEIDRDKFDLCLNHQAADSCARFDIDFSGQVNGEDELKFNTCQSVSFQNDIAYDGNIYLSLLALNDLVKGIDENRRDIFDYSLAGSLNLRDFALNLRNSDKRGFAIIKGKIYSNLGSFTRIPPNNNLFLFDASRDVNVEGTSKVYSIETFDGQPIKIISRKNSWQDCNLVLTDSNTYTNNYLEIFTEVKCIFERSVRDGGNRTIELNEDAQNKIKQYLDIQIQRGIIRGYTFEPALIGYALNIDFNEEVIYDGFFILGLNEYDYYGPEPDMTYYAESFNSVIADGNLIYLHEGFVPLTWSYKVPSYALQQITNQEIGYRERIQNAINAFNIGENELNVVCGDGVCDEYEKCVQDCGSRMFVTNETFIGYSLKGWYGADQECQRISDENLLGGIWKALISSKVSFEPTKTKVLKALNTNQYSQKINTNYALSNDLVVYEDDRNQYIDIYALNITSERQMQVTNTPNINEYYPSIFGGNVIFYRRNSEGKYAIFWYNLETKTETQIYPAEGSYANLNPFAAIDGNNIVFSGADGKIVLYDISTGRSQKITNYAADSPAISGDKIIWRNINDFQIWMCKLGESCGENDAKTQVTKFSPYRVEYYPHISKNIIVWSAITNSTTGSDVYMCDLSKNGQDGGCGANDIKTLVSSSAIREEYSVTDGNIIAWWQIIGDRVYQCNLTKNGQNGGCLVKDNKTLVGMERFPQNWASFVARHPAISDGKIVFNVFMGGSPRGGENWDVWIYHTKETPSKAVPSQDAKVRFYHSTKPYKLLNNEIVASNWNDFIDGTLQRAINVDEFGNAVESGFAWTGGGFNPTGKDFNDWSLYSVSGATVGDISMKDSNWQEATSYELPYYDKNHLYCVEQPTFPCTNAGGNCTAKTECTQESIHIEGNSECTSSLEERVCYLPSVQLSPNSSITGMAVSDTRKALPTVKQYYEELQVDNQPGFIVPYGKGLGYFEGHESAHIDKGVGMSSFFAANLKKVLESVDSFNSFGYYRLEGDQYYDTGLPNIRKIETLHGLLLSKNVQILLAYAHGRNNPHRTYIECWDSEEKAKKRVEDLEKDPAFKDLPIGTFGFEYGCRYKLNNGNSGYGGWDIGWAIMIRDLSPGTEQRNFFDLKQPNHENRKALFIFVSCYGGICSPKTLANVWMSLRGTMFPFEFKSIYFDIPLFFKEFKTKMNVPTVYFYQPADNYPDLKKQLKPTKYSDNKLLRNAVNILHEFRPSCWDSTSNDTNCRALCGRFYNDAQGRLIAVKQAFCEMGKCGTGMPGEFTLGPSVEVAPRLSQVNGPINSRDIAELSLYENLGYSWAPENPTTNIVFKFNTPINAALGTKAPVTFDFSDCIADFEINPGELLSKMENAYPKGSSKPMEAVDKFKEIYNLPFGDSTSRIEAVWANSKETVFKSDYSDSIILNIDWWPERFYTINLPAEYSNGVFYPDGLKVNFDGHDHFFLESGGQGGYRIPPIGDELTMSGWRFDTIEPPWDEGDPSDWRDDWLSSRFIKITIKGSEVESWPAKIKFNGINKEISEVKDARKAFNLYGAQFSTGGDFEKPWEYYNANDAPGSDFVVWIPCQQPVVNWNIFPIPCKSNTDCLGVSEGVYCFIRTPNDEYGICTL